ncbi:MAG: hypothetical protein R3Y64_09640 [Peptostreptococcaceae bacterium]
MKKSFNKINKKEMSMIFCGLACSSIALVGYLLINNSNNKTVEVSVQKEENVLEYRDIPMGELQYDKIFDEFDLEENKFVRQWILDNKEEKGLYVHLYEGDTYMMYSLGEIKHYGYGFTHFRFHKEEEDEIKFETFIETPTQLEEIQNGQVNIPYIVAKFKGNIKEDFILDDFNSPDRVSPEAGLDGDLLFNEEYFDYDLDAEEYLSNEDEYLEFEENLDELLEFEEDLNEDEIFE